MIRRLNVKILACIALFVFLTIEYEQIKICISSKTKSSSNGNGSRRLQFVTNNDNDSNKVANVRGINVKAYEQWDRHAKPFPCMPEDAPENEGLFYIKVPKTSSSMLAKVTSRIAAREYKRHHVLIRNSNTINNNDEITTCKTHNPMQHQHAFDLDVSKRDQSKSFLWTVMRNPSNRAISHFGMRLANGKVDTEVATFIDNLENYGAFAPNIQLEFLIPYNDTSTLKDEKNFPYLVQTVMDEYNFIGIYERLYESMTVLAMLIGVSITDMLFDYQPSALSRCGSLQHPEWFSSGMEEYLNSDKWKTRETGDFLLYDAVSKSLDMTIEYLGKDKVQEEVENFKRLIYIGTKAGREIKGIMGCGIPDLHVDSKPNADIDELEWFHILSPEDKAFVHEMKWKRIMGGRAVD